MDKTDPAGKADRPEKDKDVSVTVRTPGGASESFDFKDNTRVDKVIREAVTHFVGTRELAAGDYGLALVRSGAATPLDDSARLDEVGVVDGDTSERQLEARRHGGERAMLIVTSTAALRRQSDVQERRHSVVPALRQGQRSRSGHELEVDLSLPIGIEDDQFTMLVDVPIELRLEGERSADVIGDRDAQLCCGLGHLLVERFGQRDGCARRLRRLGCHGPWFSCVRGPSVRSRNKRRRLGQLGSAN